MSSRDIEAQLDDLFSDLEGPVPVDEEVPVSLEDLLEDASRRRQVRNQGVVFRALVENAVDAVCVSDLEGCQTYSNRACYEAFGYDYESQEMDGLPLASLWPEEDAFTLTDQVFPQARLGGWSGEVRQRRKDGTLFDAYLSCFPIQDGAGEPGGMAAIIRDISRRKSLEREREEMFERRLRQVQLVTQVSQEIAAAPTLEELHRRVVTLVKEHFGYYHVQIFSYDPEQDAMVVVESCIPPGEGMDAAGRGSTRGTGIVVTVAATSESILVSDVSQNPHWEPYPDLPEAKGELAVPIKRGDQLLGVLHVLSDVAGALTQDDEILLLELAGQIASAVEKTRLLEESSVLYQFARVPEGIGWITLEGNALIYVNPALCSILGEPKPEDAFGKSILTYYPEDVRQRVQDEILPKVRRGEQWIGEMVFRSRGDRITPVIQSIFLVRDEGGKPLYLANVVTDIAEQKQAELLADKRIKQIGCLNEIGRQIEETPEVPEFLRWVAERIPAAMQYPDTCAVAIEFEGQVYGAVEAVKLPCQIAESLLVGGKVAGHVTVSYRQHREFLEDERELLGDIARRVASYVESRRLSERSHARLEQVRSIHQLYMPHRWTAFAPGKTAAGDAAQVTVTAPRDIGLGTRLRRLWRSVAVRLFVLLLLAVLGGLLTCKIGALVQAGPNRAPAAAAPVESSSPTPASTLAPNSTPQAVPSRQPSATSLAIPPTHTSDPADTPVPGGVVTPSPLLTPGQGTSPTLTSAVPTPTPEPVISSTATALPIPTPVPPIPVAPEAINIAVMGSDRRPDWAEWHTDAVHIVSVQRDRGAVSVISIPRDLYVYIPGIRMSRINFADFFGEAYGYQGGGTALVQDTLMYNLGIRVDHCVRTNFDGLIGIVDTLGGVDIPVHCRLSDHWPYPDENGEYPILTFEPGVHHMDGETALWYARSRLTTSVLSRDKRQQQVLQAIWRKAQDTELLTQVPALWEQVRDVVMTDMTLTDVLELVPIALALEDEDVRFYNIGIGMVEDWTTPQGGWVFLPRWEEIEPVLTEALAPVSEARAGRTYLPVEVWNGTPNQDWDLLAADRVYRAGFPAIVGEPDQRNYIHTQLIIFSRSIKGSGAEYLQEMFNIPDSRVVHQPGGSADFGFRLILGADYQTCFSP